MLRGRKRARVDQLEGQVRAGSGADRIRPGVVADARAREREERVGQDSEHRRGYVREGGRLPNDRT